MCKEEFHLFDTREQIQIKSSSFSMAGINVDPIQLKNIGEVV